MGVLQRLRNVLRPVDQISELKRRGLTAGANFQVMEGCIIDPPHCWHIHIGDDVTLAPRVHILAHDASTKMHLGYTRIAKVHIGSKVFIGAGSIILPGVRIGNNVVIGAGSVVAHDIADGSVAVGAPAKVVTTTDSYLQRKRSEFESVPRFGEEYTNRQGVSSEMKAEMNQQLGDGFGYIV